MPEPKMVLLKDLLVTTKDGDWGKGDPQEGHVPFSVIRATDFNDTALGRSGKVPVRYLSERTVQRRTLETDDILIETAGGSPGRPTGRTMLVTDRVLSAFSLPITCASFARFLRVDKKIVDPRYLYWYLQSLYQSGEIEKYQVQHTGVARFQYTNFAATHQVPIIGMREQRAIAEALGALDDKIAANSKLAWTAEELLQSSYRGFINKTIPQRIRVGSIVRRIAPTRKFEKSELSWKGEFPVFDQTESGLLGYLNGDGFMNASTEKPLLYFGDHTCKLRISTQRFTVGPNTVPFEGISIPSLTLYCALKGLQKSEEYKRHWQLLMAKEILVPDAFEAEEFATRHTYLLTLARDMNRENQKLSTTRDALLPLLISGKLRVTDAEQIVSSAV